MSLEINTIEYNTIPTQLNCLPDEAAWLRVCLPTSLPTQHIRLPVLLISTLKKFHLFNTWNVWV